MDSKEIPEELRDVMRTIADLQPGQKMELYRKPDKLDVQVSWQDRKTIPMPGSRVRIQENKS